MVPILMGKTSKGVVIVFTTVPSRPVAVRISEALVRKKLVGCATILANVRSFYKWEGRMEKGREFLVMLKTTGRRYSALEKAIKAMHPYRVPEILSIPVNRGYAPYLGWLSGEVVD